VELGLVLKTDLVGGGGPGGDRPGAERDELLALELLGQVPTVTGFTHVHASTTTGFGGEDEE
jgi:hypothetical protein